MMWQEARKQERKIRGLLVDYKKRAERRKEYYEKIKADPTQFIQLHGRPCKIHLDPAIAIAADSPANMMPWQGNQDILIDRFDVRAHLDFIPELKPSQEDEELEYDDRHINYERYRILVQNDFLGVTEDKFLHQLTVEEQFGPVERLEPPPIEGKKKVPGAAISYNYNESTVVPSPAGDPVTAVSSDQEDEEDEEDSDIDFDLCVDINKIGSQQAHEMNACALIYGMTSNDFFSFLTRDVEEAENLKIAREREEEKAMYSGRKSRRERRAYREKKLIGRKISPPSYASKTGPLMMKSPSKSASKSRSRTVSPVNAGQITYITSFGGEEVQEAPPQLPKISVPQKEEFVYKRTVRYRSRSRSQSPKRRISYRAKSRSRSRGRTKSISQTRRSRSRSKDRRSRSQGHRSRSPISTSRSRSRRSRSRGNSRRSPHRQPHYRKHYNSRSRSRSKSPYKMNTSNSKKSKSPSPTIRSIQVPDPPIITRYYGRHKTNSSSSELELSDSDKESSEKNLSTSEKNNRTGLGNSIGRNKQPAAAPVVKMTPQERLKRKMQILLNRQYKADKRAERVRLEKAEQERQDREDEMREISIKMRRRERQKRHQYYEYSESAGDGEHEGPFSSISSQSLSTTPSPDPEFRHGGNSDRRSSKDREKLKEKRSKHEREERDKERRGRRERDSKDRDGRDNRIRGESHDRRDHRLRENSCDRSENRTRGSSRDNGGSRSKKEVWDRKDNRSRGESRDQVNNRTRNDSRDREDIRSRCDSRDRDIRSRGGTRDRQDSRSRKNNRDSEHQSRSSRDRESRSKGVSSRGESSKITRPLVDY